MNFKAMDLPFSSQMVIFFSHTGSIPNEIASKTNQIFQGKKNQILRNQKEQEKTKDTSKLISPKKRRRKTIFLF